MFLRVNRRTIKVERSENLFARRKGMRILLVDDEVNLLLTMAAILRRAGHIVLTASCAQEALQALRKNSFDLMFLDVRMPEVNGLELLPQVLAIAPNLRVIMLTAFPNQETQARAASLGASGFLVKPLDPSRLLEFTQAPDGPHTNPSPCFKN
jgi:DNA-binding NtrC family response regulator